MFILEFKSNKSLTMLCKSINIMHRFGLGIMNKDLSINNLTASIKHQKINKDGIEVRLFIQK